MSAVREGLRRFPGGRRVVYAITYLRGRYDELSPYQQLGLADQDSEARPNVRRRPKESGDAGSCVGGIVRDVRSEISKVADRAWRPDKGKRRGTDRGGFASERVTSTAIVRPFS